MHVASGSLAPVPPFHFARSLRFLEGFSPTEGEQAIAAGGVRKATRVGGRTLLFEVRSTDDATVERPELACELWSAEPFDRNIAASTVERIGAFLSIDDDVAAFYERARDDPVLTPHVDRLYGLHQVRFLTPFENACWAVMGQRTPIAMARRVKDAFVERYGGAIDVDGVAHRAFPEPGDVAGLTPEDIRPLVRNDRRATYLANVIEAWQDVDGSWLRSGPYDDVAAGSDRSPASASGRRCSCCSGGWAGGTT